MLDNFAHLFRFSTDHPASQESLDEKFTKSTQPAKVQNHCLRFGDLMKHGIYLAEYCETNQRAHQQARSYSICYLAESEDVERSDLIVSTLRNVEQESHEMILLKVFQRILLSLALKWRRKEEKKCF